MSPDEIKHFLVIHDTNTRHTEVRSFGTDYDAAQEAYAQIEQETLDRPNIDAVLLGADSLATIKRTHSSYFDTNKRFETLLPAGVLHG
jgi:hypothetical protein